MAKKVYKEKLNSNDITKMSIRTLLNQAVFNSERMQNIGFLASFLPELEKVYEGDEKGLQEAAETNLEFINTHNVTLPFLIGLMLSLYEKGEKPENVRTVKVSLFGPLAGLGDALFWFTLLPIMVGISASLASEGNILGPIVFFLVFFAAFLLRIPLGHWGYNLGTEAFEKLTANTKRVNQAASILALTILGGLVASYVNLEVLTTITTGAGNEISLQKDFFDMIFPNLLPLGFTFGVYGLLKKKVSPTVIILSIIIISVLLSYFGIL